MKGIFITIEGGEGSGKTTLIKHVHDALSGQGHKVVMTREPGGSFLGENIRSLLLHADKSLQITSRAELFLFLASRIQHIEELIAPQIKNGAIVLCDRFSDSTIAYQGAGRNLGMEYVTSCCELATRGLKPDLTFFIDIDPKIGLERTQRRRSRKAEESHDRIEDEDFAFHTKVREAFHLIATQNPARVVSVNGALSQQLVFTEVMKRIDAFLLQQFAKKATVSDQFNRDRV